MDRYLIAECRKVTGTLETDWTPIQQPEQLKERSSNKRMHITAYKPEET